MWRREAIWYESLRVRQTGRTADLHGEAGRRARHRNVPSASPGRTSTLAMLVESRARFAPLPGAQSLWWPRRPLATLGRKPRQGRKAATVSIDAGAEVSRRGHRLHLFPDFTRTACTRVAYPGCALHGPVATGLPSLQRSHPLGAAGRQQRYRSTRAPRPAGGAIASICSRISRGRHAPGRRIRAVHCTDPWRRACLHCNGHIHSARPEGSNGIDRRGRRGQPAGPSPFHRRSRGLGFGHRRVTGTQHPRPTGAASPRRLRRSARASRSARAP